MVSGSVATRYCAHKKSIMALAAADKTPAFMSKINHIHNPVLETKKGAVIIMYFTKSVYLTRVPHRLEAKESQEAPVRWTESGPGS